ncbi:MAG: hypothetical protein ACHQVK_05005 [Candidatus Paceibacterales bacterium]
MVNQNNEEKKEIPVPLPEKQAEVFVEPQEMPEPQEIQADEATNKKVRQEIEAAHLDDDTKAQTQNNANDLKSLQEEEQLKRLLDLAKTKGVVYAVHVAQKLGDGFLLDTLHDRLAKEGLYKEFIK